MYEPPRQNRLAACAEAACYIGSAQQVFGRTVCRHFDKQKLRRVRAGVKKLMITSWHMLDYMFASSL